MKKIESFKKIKLDFEILYPLDEICFLDIETTGLSRKHHEIYLIGLLTYEKNINSFKLTQYFSESVQDEGLILIEFIEDINNYKYLISYNGNNFDIPFIKEKLDKYGIKPFNIESIDLYSVLKKSKDFISFSNFKLKTVEKELGITREDTFTGLECIEFYKNYLITRSDSLFNHIINHNKDDLYSMPSLLNVFNIIKENRSIKLNVLNNKITLEILTIDHVGDLLLVSGDFTAYNKFLFESYQRQYSVVFKEDAKFKIKIELNRARIKEDIAYYVNTNMFELNNEIIDRSGHKPPNKILILRVLKTNILENIKNLTREIVSKEIQNLI